MLGDRLIGLKVSVEYMELAKELLREEDCSSMTMKRSGVWQTRGLQRRSTEKLQYVWK